MWDQQADILKSAYRVIAYDLRGHGDSDSGTVDFSVELFTEDLMGLMDALNLDRVVLCGLSLGGYIALNAIEVHPGRFSRLILADTQCIADTPEIREKRLETIERIKSIELQRYADESVRNLFAPESLATRPEAVESIRQMILNTSKHSLGSSLLALAGRKETCSGIGGITVPVLILVGEHDHIAPVTAAKFMNHKITGSEMHVIRHAGHLSNLENPEEFNSHLVKFLSD